MSGVKTSVYSVRLQGEADTLFEQFINENVESNRDEIQNILIRLQEIGSATGARDIFFKHNEGKPGDGVCALYDEPKKDLRLYCIRYGCVAIILGGGGPKNGARAWQNDEKLSKEAKKIIEVSNDIQERLREKELEWLNEGTELTGNLNFSDDENQ
ncbi:hypothetical protein [Daejeonella sp.]|uniref:hypothetical protein n=1 Tax=Daejeonella sp. TaxID=2805397 RepID=UPI0030C51D18